MRKLFALLLTLAVMLSMTSFATAEALSDDIVILYTNDVHTYIDKTLSYDVIAGVKAELLKQYKNVLLVDAGDHAQGTAYGSMDKGESIIKLMNAAGYDLATLGNHEFDYGMEGCIKLREWAAFPYTSCNFYHEENNIRNENVLDSYVAYTFGDKTVAFVGITTPESFTKSTPAYFQDENGNYIYGIAGGTDGKALYQDVQDAIDEAKKAGATTVIALGHLGDDKSSEPWTSEETIANVCGLDAFIDGHSHSTVFAKEVADKDGHTTILTQTGEYFGLNGMMVIDAETGAISTELLTANAVENGYEIAAATVYNAEKKAWDVKPSEFYKGAAWPTVEAVTTLKKAWIDEVTTALGVVIGSANVSFENYVDGKRMVRSQETNTGDFAADALYYLFDNMGLDVDVAIMNGGGVRNKAGITGEISYLLCKEIHTFGNVACLQTITGQELLDALEWGARTAGTIEECGGFLHVSGITYKIDGEYPSTVQQDEKGVWLGGPTGGYRVHDVKVYNKETNAYEALDLTASYNLAGYNYTLRDLGDGFNMFASAVNVLDYVLEDYMVLANYVQGFENATVEATNSPLLAKYAGMLLDYSTVYGSGRIVFESSVK